MSKLGCATPAPLPDLLAYWFGEMEEPSQSHFEEHFFGCTQCSDRLGRLVQLTGAVRQELREGQLSVVLCARFIQRLKQAGMRIREYRLQPGGSVNCTVAPQDDLVVSYLHAPLHEVRRLDLMIDEGAGATCRRLPDVIFDPARDEVVLAPSVAQLRGLGVATQRVELIAVGATAERVIGRYTFLHSPWSHGR